MGVKNVVSEFFMVIPAFYCGHQGARPEQRGLGAFSSAFNAGAATFGCGSSLDGRGQVVFHRQEAREDPFCNTDPIPGLE